MKNYHEILKNLKELGLRMTPVRKALISTLITASTPLSESDIRTRLRSGRALPDKTTVYRQIETLKNLGIVVELEFGEGLKRYEIASRHHHHLICQSCKKIEEVSLKNDLKNEEQYIKSQKHFMVNSHMLEFFGLCRNCQASS